MYFALVRACFFWSAQQHLSEELDLTDFKFYATRPRSVLSPASQKTGLVQLAVFASQ